MIRHYKLYVDGGPRYLCNKAVNPFDHKMTKDWDKVNCLNCKQQEHKWRSKE